MTKRKRSLRFSISSLLSLAAVTIASAALADESVLTIDDLIAETLAANPELAIYQAEIDAVRGERRQAGRWANPEFSLEAGHKRVRGSAGAGAAEGVVWAASVAQPIEFRERLALRKAIADRNVELAELGVEHFRLLLANQVRRLASALYAARAAADAADEVAVRAQELTEAVLQREVGGISPLLESRILESSALGLQRRRQEARQTYQHALIELNQLRDVPAETPVRLAEPPFASPELPPVDELIRRAWETAFEAKAREVELEQQGFRLRLERNERYPAITVAPFISQEAAGERETVAGVGVSLPLPLWDRNDGNVRAAAARLRQAEGALLVMRRDLERRVVEQALNYRAAGETLARMRPAALEDFQQAAELAERHYRLGAVPIGTYLEMQNAYLDALEGLLDLRQQALESRLELEMLIGPLTGGTEE